MSKIKKATYIYNVDHFLEKGLVRLLYVHVSKSLLLSFFHAWFSIVVLITHTRRVSYYFPCSIHRLGAIVVLKCEHLLLLLLAIITTINCFTLCFCIVFELLLLFLELLFLLLYLLLL